MSSRVWYSLVYWTNTYKEHWIMFGSQHESLESAREAMAECYRQYPVSYHEVRHHQTHSGDRGVTHREFDEYAQRFFHDMVQIIGTKGNDYTQGEKDRLDNFKQQAAQLGLTPMKVWSVLFNKHVAAVMTYARTGKVASEPIHGRFLDIAVYAILGAALAEESENAGEPNSSA